ncbi:arabinan endo-1,5-alpha-L-arabinosidase [Orlajensenia leifsoniae]|uniref:Arabinan endo-1,5-alpha-L-arabinosidase n=1 Tax=Orlajensenia leifsoniae TaxID=2561933 RepID=A0A4Y9QWX0_9MICO|nr:arabinan endo-1,5-alpha-L-arabinosidase [Leifsonia flava]TFV96909.1 arabinan endo-1,5-alpha-L-arabinosidase [Leifsonia flava]
MTVRHAGPSPAARAGSGGRAGRLRSVAALAAVALAASIGLAGCAASGARDLSGDLSTHDPALAHDGDTWFVYSTGNQSVADGNIQVRTSADGTSWQYAGEVWEEKPDWVTDAVPGVSNLWAPELIEHDGTWYLYYSASTFGTNASVIGLATNSTLDPDDPDYDWVDRGAVVTSTTRDDFNAIDPGIVEDSDGTPWMAFGSFWSGIRMVELAWPDGLRADDADPLRLADRQSPPNAIEAPYIVEHEGDYFLFVSRDSCCQGVKSTYNVVVGRADEPTGPYVDRDGTPLLQDGGTLVIATDGERIGPGGQSVADGMMALHFYNGDAGGAFELALLPLRWDADGWPSVQW